MKENFIVQKVARPMCAHHLRSNIWLHFQQSNLHYSRIAFENHKIHQTEQIYLYNISKTSNVHFLLSIQVMQMFGIDTGRIGTALLREHAMKYNC